ncbi:MAG: glutathione S-transferase N-terminal domain-containing protein [Brasilonema octagenarum HA4186-MV1]|jgi:glutathione S-transferase|uniref:Glutathione S-transferase family protein n=2 Tax=Brasilonema TaxID=383614 RepID=A0A856MC19_9CYAN|nr:MULTISPECIES: glutathione S-transferase family protein [Brasilonema]MBW4627936.1 glutathione S-transferase N-terminal domain-containing protein [Brasilonema octagenarum HA4186-MV1]NMF62869.1 glutathione S-transferase family protein [Brasilonema octagenarum UFV-OR1]QDL08723.1 glutathione S-transferase family protein [Brasilonema sennae CENA114]QDL15079.1 glutathione S-transferase family protein [Brasilonema octagenarum UFV-E1]
MKLYYAPASSYSQRVLIALYEKGVDFTAIPVNLFDPESREEYMQINLFAKIPTLVTDKGNVIFEANIIIEYLDQRFPNTSRLIPVDSEEALEVRMVERMIDVYINNGREALFADTQRPVEERGKKEVIKAKRLLETAIAMLDEKLATRTWLGGEEFTIADCAAAPTFAYLRMVYNYKHFPNLTNYVKRLESRLSVAQVFNSGRNQMTQMLSELRNPLQLVPLES